MMKYQKPNREGHVVFHDDQQFDMEPLRSARRKSILPPEFLDYWRTLVCASNRSVSSAHELLMGQWKRGEAIPGYPVSLSRDRVPYGWSLSNLWRISHSPLNVIPLVARHIASSVTIQAPVVGKLSDLGRVS